MSTKSRFDHLWVKTNHVATWASAGEKHVGWDLPKNVADEKDRDTGLVLCK